MMERIIWTNDIDISDEAINAFRKDYELEDASDDDVLNMMNELCCEDLDCEIDNLNLDLVFPILVIGDLGRWDGRFSGYKILGTNLNDIFDAPSGDYVTFYADSYNIRCTDIDHDGRSYYLFRELRCPPESALPLLDAIYEGKKISSSMLNRYTRSLRPYVAEIYGWRAPKQKTTLVTSSIKEGKAAN